MNKIFTLASVLSLCSFTVAATVEAATLTNGDFATGDLTGWTVYTTGSGSNGSNLDGEWLPRVTTFDLTQTGTTSNVAQFRAGREQAIALPGAWEGGGLRQSVFFDAGRFTLAADAAVQGDHQANTQSGALELMFEGEAMSPPTQIALWNFAGVSRGMTKYQTLVGEITIATPGWYNLSLQWTRPFLASPTTPSQYIGNLRLEPIPTSVPEPTGAAALLLMGVLGFSQWVQRKSDG